MIEISSDQIETIDDDLSAKMCLIFLQNKDFNRDIIQKILDYIDAEEDTESDILSLFSEEIEKLDDPEIIDICTKLLEYLNFISI